LKQLGFDAIDLACRPSQYDPTRPVSWGNNAAILDLNHLEELTAPTATLLREHSLPMGMLLGYARATQREIIGQQVQAARAMSCQTVRLWPARGRDGNLRQRFEEERAAWHELIAEPAFTDIRFVVEVHENTLCSCVSGALRLLDGLPSDRVGVIYDVGNSMQEGNEPLEVCLDLLGDLLISVHVKDKKHFHLDEHWCRLGTEATPLGEGDVQWPEIFRLLRERNDQGPICLENFTGFDRGPERIAQDLNWLQSLLQ